MVRSKLQGIGTNDKAIIFCLLPVLSTFLTLSMAWIWQSYTNSVYTEAEHAITYAQTLGRLAEPTISSKNPKGLQQIVQGSSDDPAVEIAQIIDLEGSVLAAFCRDEQMLADAHQNVVLEDLVDNPYSPLTYQVKQAGTRLEVVISIRSSVTDVNSDNLEGEPDKRKRAPVLGFLRLVYSLKRVQDELSNQMASMVLISVVITIVSISITILVIRQLLKPVGSLVQTTTAIVNGDLTKREPENAVGEIGGLARAINRMADRLQDGSAEIDMKAKELRENEQLLLRLQAALDDAGDAIAVVDENGEAIYLNTAFNELFDSTLDMINENGWSSICVDRTVGEEIFHAILNGDNWKGETEMESRQGYHFPAEVRASPIMNDRARIIGILLMINDISDRKRIESELLHAQKLTSIGQLSTGIAHEINTPMQYVGDNIQYLQTCFEKLTGLLDKYDQLFTASKHGTKTAELLTEIEEAVNACRLKYLCKEIPEAIEDARDGAETVSRIVRAMKEFSHPGVEGKTNIDINRAIESTIMVARNEWKYVAEVETDFDTDLPLVPCLASELNQVILNILVNAVHAIRDVVDVESGCKGTITVSTHRRGNWAEIRMRDTGAGIPQEVQSRVFDPFFTTKQVGQGTGQGLAISHNVVVEKHGGMITFETEPGNGTTFIIRLPISTEATEKDTEINAEVMHAG